MKILKKLLYMTKPHLLAFTISLLKGEASLNRAYIRLRHHNKGLETKISQLEKKVQHLHEHGQRMHERWRESEKYNSKILDRELDD